MNIETTFCYQYNLNLLSFIVHPRFSVYTILLSKVTSADIDTQIQ